MKVFMRAFADWVTARSMRTSLFTVLAVVLMAPLATSLVVLDYLRRGNAGAVTTALIAIVVIAPMALLLNAPLGLVLELTVPSLLVGLVCGALLYRTHSLNLTYQAAVVGGIATAAVLLMIAPDGFMLGEYLYSEWQTMVERTGLTAEELAEASIQPRDLLKLAIVLFYAVSLAAVMLGLWWFSLIQDGVNFGKNFRALKLGRAASFALVGVVLLGQFLQFFPLQVAASLAVIGFLFQGLAVMHSRARSDNWPSVVITLVYVLMIPLNFLIVYGLSAVGMLDNFFDLRSGRRLQN